MPSPSRTSHPFFMYDHIQSQPDAFREVVLRHRRLLTQLSVRLSSAAKIYLVGIGTSLHAAEVGGHLFRCNAPQLAYEVWHAYDFCRFGPRLTAKDYVIALSHRGTKQYTLRALERAKEAECMTAIITGIGAETPSFTSDVSIETVEQERSSAHTVSFFGAVAVLAELVGLIGNVATSMETHKTVAASLTTALQCESQMAEWAADHHFARRIWLVGSGPAAVVARETALKIKETSYLQAESLSTETMLHGPFQCCEPDDLFVLLAIGKQDDRMAPLSQMIQSIGAKSVLVTDNPTEWNALCADTCVLPPVPTPFEALTSLVPMQLFTYYLALERQTNPDGFRLDDPRFAKAMSLVNL